MATLSSHFVIGFVTINLGSGAYKEGMFIIPEYLVVIPIRGIMKRIFESLRGFLYDVPSIGVGTSYAVLIGFDLFELQDLMRSG